MDTQEAAAKGKEFVDRQLNEVSRAIITRVMGIVIVAILIGFTADTLAYYLRKEDMFTWVGINIITLSAALLGYYSMRVGAIRQKIAAELVVAGGTVLFAIYMFEVINWLFKII